MSNLIGIGLAISFQRFVILRPRKKNLVVGMTGVVSHATTCFDPLSMAGLRFSKRGCA